MGWYNNDGLYVKFGTEEATVANVGNYNVSGPENMIELKITDMTALGTSAAIQDAGLVVPKNAFIQKVEVIVDTACTGTNAALNVGLIRTDRSTELDYDGLIAAGAVATLAAAGNIVEYTQGSTGHGALIGTTLANNGYLTADYDTAAFTAGAITIRVWYRFN